MQRESGDPKDETEITPEMIEAGLEALRNCRLDDYCDGYDFVVRKVFTAMICASSSSTKAPEREHAASLRAR
jgi:hypothetical protein